MICSRVKTPFFKEFGMVDHKNFLDDFVNELEQFKHEMEGFEKVMEVDFGSDSRVIHNRFRDFYNNYKSYKITSCLGGDSKETYISPFQSWTLHNPKYLNTEIEREVKEIVQFGDHIHKAAYNMQHIKDKDSQHMYSFKLALRRFKDHLMMMNQNFYNYYGGVLDKYKDFIKRTKHCSFIIGISFIFYAVSLAVPKQVIRIQISLGLLCSAFLLWNGLKLYSEVVYRTKGCLAANEIIHDKYTMDEYLIPKDAYDLYADSMYKWCENCFSKGAEGDIENVLNVKDKTELEYGLSILRGLSHNLSFLEEADYEPKAFLRFSEELTKFKNYEKMRGMGFGLSMMYYSDPRTILIFMNSVVKCTKNYFVLNPKDCKKESKVFQNGHHLMEELEGDYCIPLQNYEHLKLIPRYKQTCVEEKSLEKLQSYYEGLRACTKDHDRLADLMIKDFNEMRDHVKTYLKKFKDIEEYYKKNRDKFKKSIKSFEERNLSLSHVMDCKNMNYYVRMALGNACYEDYNIYISIISAILILFSGLILLIITVLRLVEIVRFWASRGNDQLGLELGGV